MKYKTKYRHKEERIRTAFLIFPKSINGETRWLTKTSWKEMFLLGSPLSFWYPLDWLDVANKKEVEYQVEKDKMIEAEARGQTAMMEAKIATIGMSTQEAMAWHINRADEMSNGEYKPDLHHLEMNRLMARAKFNLDEFKYEHGLE